MLLVPLQTLSTSRPTLGGSLGLPVTLNFFRQINVTVGMVMETTSLVSWPESIGTKGRSETGVRSQFLLIYP